MCSLNHSLISNGIIISEMWCHHEIEMKNFFFYRLFNAVSTSLQWSLFDFSAVAFVREFKPSQSERRFRARYYWSFLRLTNSPKCFAFCRFLFCFLLSSFLFHLETRSATFPRELWNERLINHLFYRLHRLQCQKVNYLLFFVYIYVSNALLCSHMRKIENQKLFSISH